MNSEHKKTRKESTLHNEMLNTAMKNFFTVGIKAVRMDDLALTFGISKRTLYKMFSNKEHLLLECMMDRKRKRMERMAEIYAGSKNILEVLVAFHYSTLEETKDINNIFFEELNKYPKIIEYLKEEGEKNRQKSVNFFQRGVEQGLIQPDLDLELLTKVFYNSNEALFREGWTKEHSLEQISHTLLLIYIRGCTTVKGREIFEVLIRNHKSNLSSNL